MGIVLALPLAALSLTALAFGWNDLSVWGWLWSLASLALAGVLGSAGRPLVGSSVANLPRRLAWVGIPLLVVVRVGVIGGSADARLVVLGRDGERVASARWVDRLFEERDAALVGSRLLTQLDVVPAPEFPTLPDLLRRSYGELERRAPRLGTPVPATLLGLQRSGAFDAIVVDPTGPGRVGVVFLHGYAGNFALQCLEVAVAARAAGALTLCPSTSFKGAWSTHDGEATVRASIANLRARGAQRIVLAGLSAGAIGASLLAPRLRDDIQALVLISGVSPRAPTPTVPTLVIQGDHDSMVSTARVRTWARGRARTRYMELPGTHFVLLEQRAAIASEIHRVVGDLANAD